MHDAHPQCHPESRLHRDEGSGPAGGLLAGDSSVVPRSSCKAGLPQNDSSFSVTLKAKIPPEDDGLKNRCVP